MLMLGRLIAQLFPDLDRVDELRLRRQVWISAYEPVLKSPRYWLIALLTHVVGQVAVTVPLTRLTKSRGYYTGFVEWGLPILVALLACLVIIWLFRWGITRNLRQELTSRGWPTCISCGYDLTGNESGTCPECGATVGS